MMRGEYKQPNIFSMSFLDVLCCTVGALIFILFIQTLRTRDMVRLEEPRAAAKKEKEELESELAAAMKRLEEIREELKEKDVTILKLVKELQEPKIPAGAG